VQGLEVSGGPHARVGHLHLFCGRVSGAHALDGALGSAPVDDRTVAFFLARARYARYMPDLRPALAVDA